MALTQDMLITARGWEKLTAELRALRLRRQELLIEIDQLRQTGPFDAFLGSTRVDLGLLDRQIAQIEDALARSVPIDEGDSEPGVVGVGSRVEVEWDDGERECYVLVGPPEVDLDAGLISYEAPVGKALLGRRLGDRVEVQTPSGTHVVVVARVE